MSDAANSEARLESILDQVRELKDEYGKQAKATGENFNVFSILDRERKEVTTHSAIIAELLNPHGSHSQGTLFLELFLKQLNPIIDVRNEHTRFKVRTEVFVFVPENEEKGFLDIVIESNNNDAYIVIENKIDTEDAEGQLKKYCEHIETIEKNKKVLLYLTPEGKNPIYLTHYGKGKVALICLSYKEFIAEWLDACIKEVPRIPQIRETLHQYQMTVKKLTGYPINRRYPMALKNILLEDKNFNLIPDLKDALSGAQTDLQLKFWNELKNQLEAPKVWKDLNDKVKNLRYETYLSELGIVEGKEETEECIRNRPGRQSPGLTFNFPNKNHEIMFRITHDGDWNRLYYGFVLFEKGKRVKINEAKLSEYPYLKIYNGEKGGWNDGYLTYKYFAKPVIDFTDCKSVEEYIRELVKERVDEICGVIKNISEKTKQ